MERQLHRALPAQGLAALLGFDVVGGRLDCYVPPFAQEKWLRRFAFFEKAGDRWWPIAGGVYFLRATKKVLGMRVLTPAWQRRERRNGARARGARARGADDDASSDARRRPATPVTRRDAPRAASRVERRRRSTPTARARAIPAPAAGARCCVVGGREKELFGGEPHTTNNRMELTAVIRALEALKRACDGRALHRFAVREERHRELDPRLEAQRLEDRATASRSRTPTCGASSTRSRRSTASAGTGCAATPTTRATSAPTRSPTAAWTAIRGDAAAADPAMPLARPGFVPAAAAGSPP